MSSGQWGFSFRGGLFRKISRAARARQISEKKLRNSRLPLARGGHGGAEESLRRTARRQPWRAVCQRPSLPRPAGGAEELAAGEGPKRVGPPVLVFRLLRPCVSLRRLALCPDCISMSDFEWKLP